MLQPDASWSDERRRGLGPSLCLSARRKKKKAILWPDAPPLSEALSICVSPPMAAFALIREKEGDAEGGEDECPPECMCLNIYISAGACFLLP